MSEEKKRPGGMFETFGAPPTSIQKYLTMSFNEAEGVITFIHSSLIPKNDPALRNYLRGARRIAENKFPDLKIQIQALEAKQFEGMDSGARNDEINESSKNQSDIIQLIKRCADMGASDIHIDSHEIDAIIRARVNGELTTLQHTPKKLAENYISVIYNTLCEVAESMYTGMEFQDAVFRRDALPANLSGVRVTCGPSMNGPFMVMRLLYKENIELLPGVNPLEQLGYNNEQVGTLQKLMANPSGIIFVAGPTGSGKSTTLKYIIKSIAEDPSINFISVEDPPEYNIENVRQIPVAVRSDDDDRDAAFSKAIRSALRSDPDRIMIGEIRDSASAIMAITCAQTGHQVWTTVHANSTFNILIRMLNLLIGPKYSERQAISVLSDPTIVNGLMFQRLAPVLCPHCRIPIKDNEDRIDQSVFESLCRSLVEKCQITDPTTGLTNQTATMDAVEEMVYDNVYLVNNDPDNECPHCIHGVKGRTVISELVYTNAQTLDNVFNVPGSSSANAKRKWNTENKDQTLQANARKLILDGVADPGTVMGIIGPLEADIKERYENQTY